MTKKFLINVILIVIIISMIIIGNNIYKETKKSQPTISETEMYNEICKNDDSIKSILCNLNNSYRDNNKIVIIRLQSDLSNYYDNHNTDIDILLSEIKNRYRDIEYRSYLIKSMSNLNNKYNFEYIKKGLQEIVSDQTESERIRMELIDVLPQIYYNAFHIDRTINSYDLFDLLNLVMYENNDNISLAVIKSMYGYLANLDLERAKNFVITFAKNYRENYKKTPNALIYSLVILKNTGGLDVDTSRGIDYVCNQKNNNADILCRYN